MLNGFLGQKSVVVVKGRALDGRPRSPGSLLTSVYPSATWRVVFHEVPFSVSSAWVGAGWWRY